TTLMLDEFLRRRGVRDQIEIVYTYPTVAQLVRNCLFLQEETCAVLPPIFDSKDIKYQRSFTLERVDPEKKIAYSEEGGEENFDILMQTPPIRAVDAVLNSGLSDATNNEGWLPTDPATMQLKGYENVFVMGVTVDLTFSKAGGVVDNLAPVICENNAGSIRLVQTGAEYDV